MVTEHQSQHENRWAVRHPLFIGAALLATALAVHAGGTSERQELIVKFDKFQSELFAPAFRVSVYADGSVIYEGIEKVRVTGIHKFQISTEAVENLVDELVRAGLDTFRPPTGPGPAHTYVTLSISVSHPKLERVVDFSPAWNTREYVRYLSVLDSFASTRALRCPYIVHIAGAAPVELCDRADDILRRSTR